MKFLTAIALSFSCLSAFAAGPPVDFKQPASPTLPAPSWLKLVDHGQFDPRLKGYIAPEGLKIEIVAEEPTIVNPVGMAFGNDGTLYVLEWVPSVGDEWRETPVTFTYKDGSKRDVATMKKAKKDLMKVLKFNAEKKLYDKSEIILEDELPSNILLHDGWIYLASRGTVRRFKQSKPGGPYDVKEIIAQGFCGFHHHQVSGVAIGPDGWLYITSGDDDNFVEGADGSRATVLRTGAVFRCRPDGSQMHMYSLGYRNPYRDVAFDATFNIFHVDNDNEDGSKFTGCRLMHVAEESDFGWRLFTGARCCRPDMVRGAVYGELPGKMPPMLKTGRGSPAGLLIYNDTQFPQHYRGLFFYPDVFRKLIRAYRAEPDGSTFKAIEEFEFLKSDDPLFRPCQMIMGPDGTMYVCDWRTDSGGAGRLWGDGVHGRIYRLSWAGTKDHPAIPLRGMDGWAALNSDASLDTLADALASPNLSIAVRAQREIVRKAKNDPQAVKQLFLKVAEAGSVRPLTMRLLGIGGLQSVWDDEVRRKIYSFLHDEQQDVARMAADGLALSCKHGDVESSNELVKAMVTAGPAAKRAMVLAIGRIGADGAQDSLASAFAADDGRDLYLSDAIIRALERLGDRGIRKLLDIAESGVDKERDRVVDAFRTLRCRAGMTALPELIKNPHLRPAQKAELVRSYGNYLLDPPLTADPLIDLLLAQSEAPTLVKMAGLETLGLFGPLQSDRAAGLLIAWAKDRDPEMRLAALVTIEKTRMSRAVPELVKRLTDETFTAHERAAVVKTLRIFGDRSTLAPLIKILQQETTAADGKELRLEAFRSLAQLDSKAVEPFALKFVERPGEFQNEAVAALGVQPAGAKKVAELFLAGKLPRELLPHVTDNLRKHLVKNPELGKLLTEVMRGGLLIALDKAQVERVAQLVKTKGSPVRGRELYLNGRTLACINCHKLEGVGGSVGPDLTRVWETISLEKVMESMIDPSKEIKEGYQAYQLSTKNGQTYTGLKVAQNQVEVVLKDSTGKEIHVPAGDVEELVVSKQSLMPDNVISQLSFDQFIDLVAFLRDRTAQESLRGLPLEFLVAGPFPEELSKPFGPEQNPDPKSVYDGAKAGERVKWELRSVEPTGYLDFRAAFNRDRISAYAQTFVYSAKAQKVTLVAGSKDQMRIWLDGKLVDEFANRRAANPESDKVSVELKSGWNRVLVKVLNGTGPHGFYLRFTGGDGLRVAVQPGEK